MSSRDGMRHAESRCRASGFTMIELVTVIILIGITSAILGPQMFDDSAFEERGYADELASGLRHAQRIAIASKCDVQFVIDAAGYRALQQTAAGTTCNKAAGFTVSVRRGDGRTLSGTRPTSVVLVPAGATIRFDGGGAVSNGVPPDIAVGALSLRIDARTGVVSVVP